MATGSGFGAGSIGQWAGGIGNVAYDWISMLPLLMPYTPAPDPMPFAPSPMPSSPCPLPMSFVPLPPEWHDSSQLITE